MLGGGPMLITLSGDNAAAVAAKLKGRPNLQVEVSKAGVS
jgi:hypothetical protein